LGRVEGVNKEAMPGNEVDKVREFMGRLPSKICVVDFEEQMQLPSVRSTLRAWEHDGEIAGFAYVDDFDNLWFETLAGSSLGQLEEQIIEWGMSCIKARNPQAWQAHSLDTTCEAADPYRIQMLLEHGFLSQDVRTLRYERSLDVPIPSCPLPQGFWIRHARGEAEVERLVALHRSAFGTENMTIEQRLAIMRAPQYVAELDLLVVSPSGELAAFCICGFEDVEHGRGYTDPLGTAAPFQRMGLGTAILAEGLRRLKSAGARKAGLGTSSENAGMRRLAEGLGFRCISKRLWFSKVIA
jgi:ribosomal protein S18 acetylase RimI-like enzyme